MGRATALGFLPRLLELSSCSPSGVLLLGAARPGCEMVHCRAHAGLTACRRRKMSSYGCFSPRVGFDRFGNCWRAVRRGDGAAVESNSTVLVPSNEAKAWS